MVSAKKQAWSGAEGEQQPDGFASVLPGEPVAPNGSTTAVVSPTVEDEEAATRSLSQSSYKDKIIERKKTINVKMPKAFSSGRRKELAVSLAMARSTRFGMLTACVILGGIGWTCVRFYLAIDGENQVSEQAFEKLSTSIARTVGSRVEMDLIYQDMVAASWATNPSITRDDFRAIVMSEAYEPALLTSTGISLIPRVLGPDARKTLEDHADSEDLRQKCCSNHASAGGACATIAADGLFCREGRYQFTQFGANGLEPAIANTTAYIDRVGEEEYMIVDMIEPFASNSKVWGFNLLSSPARDAAWKKAKLTGQKTFTRRLNLVQSSTPEYGFLVWLPLYKDAQGDWTTALGGNTAGLTPVGSVNGVYRAQHLLSSAIESTYSTDQLSSISIFLYDNAAELNGEAQFLGAYNTRKADPYTHYGAKSIRDVEEEQGVVSYRVNIKVPRADAEWVVLVMASDEYWRERRTNNPWYTLIIGIAMIVAGACERWLGHPALIVEALDPYHTC